MFDEYFKPPIDVSTTISVATLPPPDTARASSSTSRDQDAPSPSTSPNNESTSPLIKSINVEEPNNEEEADFDSDTFRNPFAPPETSSAESSSRIVDTSNMHTFQQPHINTRRWTKDHPVLKNKARLVAKGFRQEERIDFKELLSLVARSHSHLRCLYFSQEHDIIPDGREDCFSQWYSQRRSAVDLTFFTWKEGEHITLVQIYVDDIIFASTNPSFCDKFADQMRKRFKISMMGKMSFFLGLQISQSPRGIFINQSKYALEMLKKYGLDQCDPVGIPMLERLKLDEDPNRTLVDLTRYRCIVGSLMYLIASRPDLVFAVAKIQGKILWMRSQLTNYGFDYNKIPLYCGSQSAIVLSCNSVQHTKTKHIPVKYHFIKEQVENEIVELYFVKTAYQLADIFTKALARERFEFLVKRQGMQSITPEELRHLAESDEDEE
ncbi:retrovirus-related pol polyprotein from transposon TNT 1-94 [Tanacetum coccineum]|uniref:Retrovirus-related pol polyprotein from transposon TNT 1-94 n=1 Tax=Tanacetum coccineum TaxID=301880 RepID=A0ABQ4X1F1_9ASTR